jgi:hypothetical protein
MGAARYRAKSFSAFKTDMAAAAGAAVHIPDYIYKL